MSESVNLVLKTTQINSSNTAGTYFNQTVQTSTGIVAQNRTSLTWTNISLKAVLNDMYDKYERFNICLNFVGGSSIPSAATADNRTFQVKMSGLPWTSSYDQASSTNIGKVVLTAIQLPITAGSTWVNNYFTQQYYTFTKQDYVNITIDLHTIVGDTYYACATNADMLGHCIFSFNIYGIDEYKTISYTNGNDTNLHKLTIGEKEQKIFQ